MTTIRKVDEVLHKSAKKVLQWTRKGVSVASETATKVKKNIDESDRFLSEETHVKIDGFIAKTKAKFDKLRNKQK